MTEAKLVNTVQRLRRKRDAVQVEVRKTKQARLRLKERRAQGANISRARIAAYTAKVTLLFARLTARERSVKKAEAALARFRATQRPKVVRSELSVQAVSGALGSIVAWVGHYTAGPRDRTLADALRLWRQYHEYHRSLGWGGIGYHIGIAADGTIVLLRPFSMKGTHVGGYNTGRVGIVMHGTTGDRMTAAQCTSLAWALRNTRQLGCPQDLVDAKASVHLDYNSTSCPGAMESQYREAA